MSLKCLLWLLKFFKRLTILLTVAFVLFIKHFTNSISLKLQKKMERLHNIHAIFHILLQEPTSTGDLSSFNLQEEIKRLQKQNKTCVSRLEETMISLESEKMKCRELERKLSTTEEKWELVVKRYRDNEKQLNNKVGTDA